MFTPPGTSGPDVVASVRSAPFTAGSPMVGQAASHAADMIMDAPGPGPRPASATARSPKVIVARYAEVAASLPTGCRATPHCSDRHQPSPADAAPA